MKDEGGWTQMGGGAAVKQIVRPVEGREGVWLIVYQVADIATSKDEARGDKDGDGKNDFGLLLPDSALTLPQNTASYNQLFNVLAELINEVEDDAKNSFMNSGKGIQFFKSGRLPLEIMEKMQDGTKFFGSDN